MIKTPVIASLVLALAAPFAAAAPPPVGDLLRSVPESARVVVAVDTAALRSVPTVQDWLLHHQRWTGADQDLRQFLADAGLDPIHDVDAMVVAVLGEGPETGAVALFAGRFAPTPLAAALVKRGAEAFAIGGVPAFRLPPSDDRHGKPAVLAQPSPDLVVVGNESAVRAALEPPHAVDPLVEKELAAGHIDLRAPFWVVATVPAQARAHAAEAAGRAHGEGGDAMRDVVVASGAVQRIAVQAFLDDSLKLTGIAVADTPENAELLRDAAKGALAVARLHAEQQAPELVNVLRAVQVVQSGSEVSVSGSVPLAVIEKLTAEHKAMHHRGSKEPVR
jgi:hypothetical protein